MNPLLPHDERAVRDEAIRRDKEMRRDEEIGDKDQQSVTQENDARPKNQQWRPKPRREAPVN